ncbi:MAG TPA: hypothetical protein VEJ44_06160, partial [Acidimicrobiales bacterium]|nr:hypothetical protein [Acidimicrobiales bacterium]
GLADVIKANWKKPEEDRGADPARPVPKSGGQRPVRPVPGSPSSGNWRADQPSRRQIPNPSRVPDAPADESSVGAYLVDTGIWGLSLIPAGTHLDNPSELFGSPGMQPVMDQLPLLADIVLFDSPPVLAAPDTAILGGLVHGAVVVASEGKTARNDLERTVHRLENTHCRVLGVAVNRARRSSTDSYQYYTYKNQ